MTATEGSEKQLIDATGIKFDKADWPYKMEQSQSRLRCQQMPQHPQDSLKDEGLVASIAGRIPNPPLQNA